ncbi:MAG: DUF3341 domain-containing protein [bacterium]|nr:DUF3341 domain-containing protein [bacterium]
MSANYVVIGQFKRIEKTRGAIRHMRGQGYDSLELFSPFPSHDLDDEMYVGKRRSPVRMCTLAGALTGCFGAFLMTSWMSLDWPIRTSAKPILSYPAFVVIAFECTILLGAIFTLLGMFHHSRIPALGSFPSYRPQFSEGTFGLCVKVAKEQVDAVKAEFDKCGARDVEVQYVR